MINVPYSEPVVSVGLRDGESTTIPSDEVWRVQLSGSPGRLGSPAASTSVAILVDGDLAWQCFDDSEGGTYSYAAPYFLPPGATIECDTEDSSQGGATVNGFDVSNLVDNDLVNKYFEDGDSETVPSGEKWLFSVNLTGRDPGSSHTATDSATFGINGREALGVDDTGGNESAGLGVGSNHAVFVAEGGDELEFSADGGQGFMWLSGTKVGE